MCFVLFYLKSWTNKLEVKSGLSVCVWGEKPQCLWRQKQCLSNKSPSRFSVNVGWCSSQNPTRTISFGFTIYTQPQTNLLVWAAFVIFQKCKRIQRLTALWQTAVWWSPEGVLRADLLQTHTGQSCKLTNTQRVWCATMAATQQCSPTHFSVSSNSKMQTLGGGEEIDVCN